MTTVTINIDETVKTGQTIYCKELDAFLSLIIVPVDIVNAQIGQFQKQLADSQKTLDDLNAIAATRVKVIP